jgi:hypothetical protein
LCTWGLEFKPQYHPKKPLQTLTLK